MNYPTATYRLQFRNGMTFDRAIECVPYLKALGISHLYASPIFTATTGSTHGYDVTDCLEIEPSIGGREGLERLCAALKQADLGLILDIVPNHMAASTENRWWSDVLKHGEQSAFASFLDIDWGERLTLPILGKSFDEALADDELELRQSLDSAEWCLAYYDMLLPLAPGSVPEHVDPSDKVLIARVHADQAYVLMHWKQAAHHLSYRRFFEITGLVGLRVEDDIVFDASHQMLLELVRTGHVQGLRLDHIDGLADPTAYLKRLRAAVGPEIYIVAEKILGHDEHIPTTWPIEGTTGYEFITALSHLFVDPKGLQLMDEAYRKLAPEHADFTTGARNAKRLMVERNFEGEITRLTRLAHAALPGMTEDELAMAIRELLIAFPVYRTYACHGSMNEQDLAVLERAIAEAEHRLPDSHSLGALATLLREERHFEFRGRFQQVSGPVMAKAMEDTLFYRYNRFIALNEVGGEPDMVPGGVEHFHRLMLDRQTSQPHGLSATSTHDTKRGEDARARLYCLSECARSWQEDVEHWRAMNGDHVTELLEGIAPDLNLEWMLYQGLAGIWPDDFHSEVEDKIGERFVAYSEKAIREAKLATNWGDTNEPYERAVKDYAAALTTSANQAFHEDFSARLQQVIAAGYLNSLSQTLIKLTAPGIPDIYQGAEGLDFSLVDPDNRNPVVMDELEQALTDKRPIAELSIRQRKQRLVQAVLAQRRALPSLYAGDYVPLPVYGKGSDHIVAFARAGGGAFSITVVPRLMLGVFDPVSLNAGPAFWDDTAITLPDAFSGPKRNALTGDSIGGSDRLPIKELLAIAPVALLISTGGTSGAQ